MGVLDGKSAIVTGASRGIGRATAIELARAGASVLLTARSLGEIEATAAEIRAEGGRAEALSVDVTNYAQVAAAVARAQAAFGGLDIVVNNAGLIDPIARLEASDPEGWGRVIDVNVKGVYHAMRAAAPVMRAAGGGVIVNISSGAATSPLEGWSHYCASKAAALMLTRSGDKELSEAGVRVVGLSPGTVATEMQRSIKASGVNPVSQLDWEAHIPPDWAGRAVVYLCTDAARDYDGGDMSLRQEEARKRVGLI